MPKFSTKSTLLRYIWAKILKNYCQSVPSNLSNFKISTKKQKCLNLGSKVLCLVIFGLDFKRLLSYLKSAL